MKKYILFLIPIFLLFVLCQNSVKTAKPKQVIPSDTIPMQYSSGYPNFCLPILNGFVNDSLHFKVLFDTGTIGNKFSISDSLKNIFVCDSAFLQIGKLKKRLRIEFYKSNRRTFINVFGKNTIMIGWKFFENKIIAFDFQNQRILVYNELPDVTEYSKIKITQFQDSHLFIPGQVVLQGKTLQDTFNIDTGCNDYIVLNAKHIKEQGIDSKNAFYGKATTSTGLSDGFSLPLDTIKLGNLYVANQNMKITFDYTKYKGSGLLGTRTLEKFLVILDLINYDLYLKKNDE